MYVEQLWIGYYQLLPDIFLCTVRIYEFPGEKNVWK